LEHNLEQSREQRINSQQAQKDNSKTETR